MASVKIGRRSYLRLSDVPGIPAKMGMAGLLRRKVTDVRAALPAQAEGLPASRNVCGRTAGILARVVNSSAVKIAPHSKNPVGMGKRCDASVYLKAAGARVRLKRSASVTILLDPDPIQRFLWRPAARAASQWQQIGSDQTVAEIAGELAAIQVV